jgi:excisionase family DNA binding protein
LPTTKEPSKAIRRLDSIQNAAAYAGVSTKTIRRRISDGSLTGFRMGPRLLRVDLNELDAMLRPIPTAGGHRAAS